MGLCSSSNASAPGSAGDNDREVDQDVQHCGGSTNPNRADLENDGFEPEDAGEGEKFMAVKPWIGQIAEPA